MTEKKLQDEEFKIDTSAVQGNLTGLLESLRGMVVESSKSITDDALVVSSMDDLKFTIPICEDPEYFIDEIKNQLELYIQTTEYKVLREKYLKFIGKL